MAARGVLVALFGVGVLLGGCMQSTIEPASEANLTVRDKKLLAAAPYENATLLEPYRRHIVEYHRKEAPGTILIDSDARYLYYVMADPQNPMGARAMYLFAGNKDTLYRIHGTNQPEYIGQAISSGCIRMTNEDVIDLYKRIKQGTVVVVLAPHQGDSPFSPQVASSSGLFN